MCIQNFLLLLGTFLFESREFRNVTLVENFIQTLKNCLLFDESVNIVWYELWKNQYWEDSPACIYLLKVNNRNSETICEICSKLTIKKPERRHWRRSGVFIVDFEHMSHLALMFLFLIWTCNCRLVVTLWKCQYHLI